MPLVISCIVFYSISFSFAGPRPSPSIPDVIEIERLVRQYQERKLAYDMNSGNPATLKNAANQSPSGYPYFPDWGFYTGAGTTAAVESSFDTMINTILADITDPNGFMSGYIDGKVGKTLDPDEQKLSNRWDSISSVDLQAMDPSEKFALAKERLDRAEKVLTGHNVSRRIVLGEKQNYISPSYDDAIDGALADAIDTFNSYLPDPPGYALYSYISWYSGQFNSSAPYNSRATVSQPFYTLSQRGKDLGLSAEIRVFAMADYAIGDDPPIPDDGQFHEVEGLVSTRYNGPSTQGVWSGKASTIRALLEGFNYEPEKCDSCESGECGTGSVAAKTNSAHFTFNMGSSRFGKTSGAIAFAFEKPTTNWYTPNALVVRGGFGFQGIYQANTYGLLQAIGPGVLVDVNVLSGSSYELKFYHWDGSGTPGGSGEYPIPGGAPHTVFLVENPDQTGNTFNEVKITRTAGNNTDWWMFSYDDGTDVWTYTSDNGNTIEEYAEPASGISGVRIEERTVKDGTGVILSKVRQSFEMFDWGEEMIEEIVDPDGVALTRTYDYYDDDMNDGDNYRYQKSYVDEYGYWETYQYDTYGRLIKVKAQFKDAAFDAADNLSRVTEYIYPTSTGGSVDYFTTIEELVGEEISRKYRRVYVDGYDDITCTVPGAGIAATTNLVREVRLHMGTEYSGMIKSVLNPDGTMVLYDYSALDGQSNDDIENGETLTTIVERGEPNGTGTDIVDGTRTTTVVDRRGNTLAETLVDIDSGLTVDQRLATAQDGFGRPTEITLLDGRTETYDYDCCGLVSHTDAYGITTTFDEVDNIEKSETRLGITTTTSRSGRTQITERDDNNGSVIQTYSSTVDIAGRPVASETAGNRDTTIAHTIDGSGNRVVTTTLPNGGTRIETYYPDGNLKSRTGTAEFGVAYDYGVENGGAGMQYFVKETKLDAGGSATSEWTKTYSDLAGRTSLVIGADSATWETTYNSLGQMEKSEDPDGVVTLYGYDDRGRRTTTAIDMNANDTIDLGGTDVVTRSVQSVVAGPGAYAVARTVQEVWQTDNSGTSTVVMQRDREVSGNAVWTTTPAGDESTVTTYGSAGSWTETTTLNHGGQRVDQYSGGRLASSTITNGSGTVLQGTSYTYDTHGRVASTTDARNGTTTYTYYTTDEVHTMTTPAPGDGRNAQTTTYVYDDMGRQDLVTLPDSGQVDYEYYLTGLLESVSGARTYAQLYTYTPQGRRQTLTTNDGTSDEQVTTWTYHAQSGQPTGKLIAGTTAYTTTYTPGRRLSTRTGGRSIVTTYDYDDAGRLDSVDYSDSTPDVAYTYHRNGDVKTVSRGAATHTYTFGDPGIMEQESISGGTLDGLIVDPGYDTLNRRTSLTFSMNSQSVTQTRGYQSGTSRLSFVAEDTRQATYAYHPNSSLLRSSTMTENSVTRLVEGRTYDALGYLSSIGSLGTGSTAPVQRSFTYTRNDANQIVKTDRENGRDWVYGYDSLGQVTSASRRFDNGTHVAGEQYAYAYDLLGNRTSASFGGDSSGANLHTITYTPAAGDRNQYGSITTPGVAVATGEANTGATVTVNSSAPDDRQGEHFSHSVSVSNSSGAALATMTIEATEGGNTDTTVKKRLVPKASVSPSYDADGNLTSDGYFNYTWDGENRLLSVETISGAAPAGVKEVKVEYEYDYGSRRIGRVAYEKVMGSWQVVETQKFVYHGWDLVGEWDGSNDLIKSNLWGLDISSTPFGAGGAGGLVSTAEHQGTTPPRHFFSYDGGGNVMTLTDASDGDMVAAYEYDAFGGALSEIEVDGVMNNWKYSTKSEDELVSISYYGYRFYTPKTGKWLSRDPIGEYGGKNLYAFVANQPNLRSDVLGLQCAPVGFAFTGWPDHGDGSPDNFFLDMAGGRDNANVEGGRDGAALFDFLERKTSECCCITDLRIATHSSQGEFLGGADFGFHGFYDNFETIHSLNPEWAALHPDYESEVGWDPELAALGFSAPRPPEAYMPTDGARVISQFEEQVGLGMIQFCGECHIKIHACNTGLGFASQISRISGCKVTIANSQCSASSGNDPDRDWYSDGGFTQVNPDGSVVNLPTYFSPRK